MFPPLCQRFRIELHHDGNKKSTCYLNLKSVSSDNEEGFLPTFGPAFLHFYSSNQLEGYLGKVLVALQTSLLGEIAAHEVKHSHNYPEAPLLKETSFLKYENMILHATIFNASMISKKFSDKPISFRISCGPVQIEGSGDKFNTSVTPPMKPKMLNNNYSFLEIKEKKPCVYLTLSLPDLRKRMFHCNFLSKILKDLVDNSLLLSFLFGIFPEIKIR